MSDLDDLEEILGERAEWKPRGRKKYRRDGSPFRATGDLATHCKRGHELTPDNLWIQKRGTSVLRTCKKCQRLRNLCRQEV